MRKMLHWMFLLVLMSAIGTTQAQTVNYTCDFEADSDTVGWVFHANPPSASKWVVNTAVNNTTNGTKSLYVSMDAAGATHSYENSTNCLIYAYKELNLAAGSYDLSFDWMANGEASSYSDTRWDYLRVALIPASEVLPTEANSEFYNTFPSTWIALDGGLGLCKSSVWSTRVEDAVITTAGNYKLVFFWRNDYGGGDNPPAAIDNIIFKAQTCPKPTALAISDITSDGATLTWTEMGSATEWQIEYGPTGFTIGSGTIDNISNNPYTLTGLTANTSYDVYVTSVCSSDDMSLGVKTSFRTDCGDMVLPSYEGFESYEDYSFPSCWTLRSGEAQVYNSSYNSYTGNQALKLMNNAVVLTPKYNIPAIEIGAYFAAMQYTSDAGSLEIGYVSDTALWDYTVLKTLSPIDDNYHIHDINLESYDNLPDNGYIVFRQVNAANTWSSWYIDEVNLYQLSDCRAPADFEFSNITDMSATLSWSCITDGANFQIRYDETVLDVVGATTTTLTDLTPNTIYDVEIRTMCGTDSTFWRPMGTFHTDKTCASLLTAEISNTSSTTAAVAWVYSNEGVNDPTGAFIQYKADTVDTWTSVTVTGNGYFITGLTPETRYNVKIATICGSDTSSVIPLTFSTATDGCGVVAGEGDNAHTNIPLSGYHNYSYSQSIYLSEDINGMDTIRGIKYHTTGVAQSRKINIYLANTDLSSFNSKADHIPYANMTKVYAGEYNFAANGWEEITFTTPFVSDGRNVVVCVSDTTNAYNYDRVKFRYHSGSSIYMNTDAGIINPEVDWGIYTLPDAPDVQFVGNCGPVTCKAPIVVFNSSDANSITFSWMAGLDETSWIVDYRATGDTVWSVVSDNTTDTFAVISDLVPGTIYEVRVGSLCTDDTLFATAMGVTACGNVAIPYFNNFESGELNPCWRYGTMDPEAYNQPSVVGDYLYLPINSYAILSAFDDPINTLQVRFHMNDNGIGAPLYVGVCSEMNNISSFEVVDTVYVDQLNPDADVISRLNSYEGEGQYITLKTGQFLADIDNFYVEAIPACPTPIHAHVTGIGGSYINIAWDADATATSWEATIVASGQDVATGTTVECSTASVAFTDLSVNTTYDIYISAVCGEANSENATITVTTLATDPLALPYITNFTDATANAQWTFQSVIGPNKFAIGSAVSNGNPNALYVSDDNGVSNHYSTWSEAVALAYIPIVIAEDGMHALQYDWKVDGESQWDFGRVALVPGSYDFATAPNSKNNYQNTLPVGWIAMDNGRMSEQNAWQTTAKKQNLTAGTYFLTFVWGNDGGGGDQPPLAVDNIQFMRVSCPDPTGVQVTNITSTSATVSWNNEPLATNGWEISLNGGEAIAVTDTFYTFDDLTMGSNYTVSVRTMCNDEDVSISANASFATLCSDIETLPYAINFDSYANDSQPMCWGAPGLYPKVMNGSLEFYCSTWGSSSNIITMPRLGSSLYLNQVELSFRAKADYDWGNVSYPLQVGVCKVAGGDTSFVALQTFQVSNGDWQDFIVTFNDYTDTGRYITFRSDLGTEYNTDVLVDDVVLSAISPCGRPTNVSIDSYNYNSATVSWGDTNINASFKVAIGNTNDINLATVTEDITATNYTFTGLMGSTTYHVWVAANCTDMDAVSSWVYVGQFTTEPTCGEIIDLQVYDIDETHATVSWRAPIEGSPVTDYIVSVKMNNNPATIDTIQVPYIFLNNIQIDSSYTVTVTTLCDTAISFNNSITFIGAPAPGCNTIGDGEETFSYAPTHTNYKYSLAQTIYTADEMRGMGDTIHGVTYKRTCSYWDGPDDTRQIVLYMGMTDLSDCSGGWVDTNNLTRVYSGSWNLVEGNCSIDFTTPFIYSDHTKNLVVLMDDNTGSYKSSYFYYTPANGPMTIYKYSDNESNVTFAATPSSTNNRPNIVFDATCAPITCFPPSIVVSNQTDTSIAIVWRAGNDETAWRVEYKQASASDWTVVSDNTSTMSATFNGLLPGETYNIRVGSICGTNVAYRSVTVTLDCGAMPTPFKENFENIPTGTFQKNCWYVHSDGWSDPVVADLIGDSRVLLLQDNPYVVLPQVRGDLNSLQIRLRYLAATSTAFAVVGYMTDPQNLASFHAVDTIYDLNAGGTYSTVLFNNVSASAIGQIAIWSPQSTAQVVIDDIIVEPIRTCVDPTDVQITGATTTSIDVTWNGVASNYEVVYGEPGFIIHGEAGTAIAATGSSATINGLNPGTTYEVAVRAICGAGDTSYLTNPVRATTECAAITTLPYVMNFDLSYLPPLYETKMIPNCWTIAYVDDTTATVRQRPQIVGEDDEPIVVNGSNALRMQATSILALPEMGVDMDTLCLRFFNKVSNSASRIVVGILDHVGDGCEATLQVIDTITPINAGTIEQYSVFFHNYTGTGKYIALRNIDINGALTSEQWFDSVVVDYIPSCPEVINLEVAAVGSATITVDWDDVLAPASSYEVVYGKSGEVWTNGTSVIANAHPFTIAGLNGLTNYEIWVRPICGDGDTGMFCAHPVIAQTAVCDNAIEYTTAPNGITGTDDEYPLAGWYRHSFSETIIDANYLIGMTDISAIKLKEALSSNGRMDEVQIWITHTDKTEFTSTADWYNTDSMSLVFTGDLVYEDGFIAIPLDTAFVYDGTSNLIVAMLRHDGEYQSGHEFDVVADTLNKTLYTHDDYELDHHNPPTDSWKTELAQAHAAFKFVACGGGCAAPVLSAVTDLTYESATIHWSGAGNDYEVAIHAQDDPTLPAPTAVTGNSYTFTNLTPNVTYVYLVRQICEENETSNWTEGSFTTEDLPCFAPTNVTLLSKTAESIKVSWTAAEGQTKWAIRAYNTIEEVIDTVTTNPGTIDGLTGGLTYQVSVQAICATNYASEWSDAIEVTTTDCLPVSNVSVSGITTNSAKVSWTAGGSETAWQINYGFEDFGQGEGEIVDANTNSYTITGLDARTTYDVYVRAMCSAEFSSVWSDKVSFTTEAGSEGIDGVDGNFNFVIYPNPTSGSTTISLQGVEGQVTISVVDMNGRTVTNETIECGVDCEKRIDVAGLAQGTYFVRVLGDNVNSVRKLIVR